MQRETKSYEKKQKQQQDAAKEKKQKIQEQYIQKIRQNKIHNQSNQHSPHVHQPPPLPNQHIEQIEQIEQEKSALRKEKNKRRKKEAQLEKEKKKNKQLQAQQQLLQQKYDTVKTMLYEEKQENKALHAQIRALQETIDCLQQENNTLHTKVNEQSHDRYLEEKAKFEKEKTFWHKKNQQLAHVKKQQQQTIQGLHRKIKLLEGVQYAEKQKDAGEKLLHVQRELQFYKQKLTNIEHNFSPKIFIETLQNNLTIDTVDQYLVEGKNPFGPLGADVSRVLKLQQEHFAKRQETPLKEETSSLFGYIGQTQSGWVFFDLSYHAYDITHSITLQEGKPAKARLLEDNTVHILHLFDVEPSEMKKTRQKRKQQLQKPGDNQTDYPHFGHHHVLVIGSRNQSNYTKRLVKHGVEVLWHNPFEEGYKRLSGKYQKADAVIVCTRHIPHAVLDHIDKKDEKVEFLERDNEEILASRVSYVLTRLQKTDG